MKITAMCILALLLTPQMAFAEEDDSTSFECVPTNTKQKEPDRDPIYKVAIVLASSKTEANTSTLSIIHHSRSGKTYDRFKQYPEQSWSKDDTQWRKAFLWKARKRDKQIFGRFEVDQASNPPRVTYREWVEGSFMESVCHEMP